MHPLCYQILASGRRWLAGVTCATALLVIAACGGGGSAPAPSPGPATPTVTLNAQPSTIPSGQSSVLSWTATNATGVSLAPTGATASGSSGSFTVTPATTTTYTITATGAGGTATASATVTVSGALPTISVSGADVTADRIDVAISPAGQTGNFKLELVGPTATAVVVNDTRTSGTFAESFRLAALPEGEFTSIRVTWTTATASAMVLSSYHMQVLGTYRHSQYNTPGEATCNGPDASAYITTPACWIPGGYANGTLRQQFIDQVNMNGSGTSINYGPVAREFFCMSQLGVPLDATLRTFRRDNPPVASCSSSGLGVGPNTVARCKNDARLQCGDKVYIQGVGVKTVTDTCPACCNAPGMKQLDNYTLDARCWGVLDLGNFVTVKVWQ